MKMDLAPPRQDLGGFVRWAAPSADGSVVIITFGSWVTTFLAILLVTLFVASAVFCLVLPFLALLIPGPTKIARGEWYAMSVAYLLMSILILFGARSVLRITRPSWLSLDLAARRYVLREGFRPNVKTWEGTFDDIQKIYAWERRERSSSRCIYNVIISWTMRGVETSLWTCVSKRPDDPKPEAWARDFSQSLGVPFGGILTGRYKKTWKQV